MPVLRPADAVRHEVHGASFHALVAPSRGSTELCAWRLEVPPGQVGAPHRPSREEVLLVPTQVSFAALSAQDIADYVASGEPMGRAGAYAIQGGAERFVSRLDGSYSGVMGLPLHQTSHLLRAFGVL
jgi:hypothetical protein